MLNTTVQKTKYTQVKCIVKHDEQYKAVTDVQWNNHCKATQA